MQPCLGLGSRLQDLYSVGRIWGALPTSTSCLSFLPPKTTVGICKLPSEGSGRVKQSSRTGSSCLPLVPSAHVWITTTLATAAVILTEGQAFFFLSWPGFQARQRSCFLPNWEFFLRIPDAPSTQILARKNDAGTGTFRA